MPSLTEADQAILGQFRADAKSASLKNQVNYIFWRELTAMVKGKRTRVQKRRERCRKRQVAGCVDSRLSWKQHPRAADEQPLHRLTDVHRYRVGRVPLATGVGARDQNDVDIGGCPAVDGRRRDRAVVPGDRHRGVRSPGNGAGDR
jgi:hypothetical protein